MFDVLDLDLVVSAEQREDVTASDRRVVLLQIGGSDFVFGDVVRERVCELIFHPLV